MYEILYKESYKRDVLEVYKWHNTISNNLAEKLLLELKESEKIIRSNPKANARIVNKKYQDLLFKFFLIKSYMA